MRLLIVNPNTSLSTTERIRQAANAVAGPGDAFVTQRAAFGPALIVTPEDGAEAARGVVETVRRYADTPDGIVLGSFGDTGAQEVRGIWPEVPVIGIAEAAFAAARQTQAPFSIVTFAPEVAPPLRQKAVEHGAGDALLQVASLPGPISGDPATMVEALAAPMAKLCRACAARGAKSIVVGGGPMAGLAALIAAECPVPLIDGTQEAVAQMRARLGSQPPRGTAT